MAQVASENRRVVGDSAPDAAPGSEPGDLDLGQARLVIDHGLLMVLGPDGDPVPPAAFAQMAAHQPDAELALADGARVTATRTARVLEAQSRGRLGAESRDADGWIRTALGIGPRPVDASGDDLAAEDEAATEHDVGPEAHAPSEDEALPEAEAPSGDGAEVTLFGNELVVSTASGTSFVIVRTRPETGSDAAARFVAADGTPLDFTDVVAELRGDADRAARDDGQPAGALVADDGCLRLAAAAGGRTRLEPLGDDDAPTGAAAIYEPSGEPATLDALRAALRASPETQADRPGETAESAAATEPEPRPDDPGGDGPGSALTGLPETLVRQPDGTVDLGCLAEAAAQLDVAVDTVKIAGMPESAVPSRGGRSGDGAWTLAAGDLTGLALFTDPNQPLPSVLTVTFHTADDEASVDLEIVAPPSAPDATDVTDDAAAIPADGAPTSPELEPPASESGTDAPGSEPDAGWDDEEPFLTLDDILDAAEQAPYDDADPFDAESDVDAGPDAAPFDHDRDLDADQDGADDPPDVAAPGGELPSVSGDDHTIKGEPSALRTEADEPRDRADTADVETQAAAVTSASAPAPQTGSRRAPAAPGRTRLPLAIPPCFGAVLYLLHGVPPEATLSAGVRAADGSWTLVPDALDDLMLDMPASRPQAPTLEARAVTIHDRNGAMSTTSRPVGVRRAATEVWSVPLDLADVVATSADGAGVDAVVIGGLPGEARLSAGLYDERIQSWVVRSADLDDLRIAYDGLPSAPVDLRITVVAIDRTSGKSSGRTQIVAAPLPVRRNDTARRAGGVGFWRPRAAVPS